MAEILQLLMANRPYNKGFSLLEGLVILLIVSFLTIKALTLPFNATFDFLRVQYVSEEILLTQYYSMLNLEANCFQHSNVRASYPLCFRTNGNINRAQTVEFVTASKVFRLVFQLGSGKHEVR